MTDHAAMHAMQKLPPLPVIPQEQRPRAVARPLPALEPGTRVRITQYVRHGHKDELRTREIVGTILQSGLVNTGSWFAHPKSHKVELNRILVQKDDGEQSLLIVDPRTRITILSLPPGK